MGILGIENRTENWKTANTFTGCPTRPRFALSRNWENLPGFWLRKSALRRDTTSHLPEGLDWDDMDETAEQAIERAINAC